MIKTLIFLICCPLVGIMIGIMCTQPEKANAISVSYSVDTIYAMPANLLYLDTPEISNNSRRIEIKRKRMVSLQERIKRNADAIKRDAEILHSLSIEQQSKNPVQTQDTPKKKHWSIFNPFKRNKK